MVARTPYRITHLARAVKHKAAIKLNYLKIKITLLLRSIMMKVKIQYLIVAISKMQIKNHYLKMDSHNKMLIVARSKLQ